MCFLCIFLVPAAIAALLPLGGILAGEVDYSRDIRPLLSENCYKCHGPDAAVRKAELRLDTEEGTFRKLSAGGFAAVRGDSAGSKLYQRISTDDPAERMPPPDSGKVLTAEQIALIKAWLDQGATWREHWAFLRPERSPEPKVPGGWSVRSPIDSFILSRLEREGLEPSAEADRYTLIRRATLDLTGLPPSIAEVDAFVKDSSPCAYEKLVDRLLASSRYGEHQARYWLDAARYGDTHGLHMDNERSLWPYRDWVISAFNSNLPFDQFTIQQLAGDVLPDPTREQLIATGFNRCNVSTSEGGAIKEEFLVRYAVDRVETTSTVWMGLTMGCAACHEHKFDPFSQKEFYELFAFFYSLTEKAMDGNALLPTPFIRVPTQAEERHSSELQEQIHAVEKRFERPLPEVDTAQVEWESSFVERLATLWEVPVVVTAESEGGATLTILEDGSVLATGQNPEKDVYELVLRTELKEISALRLEVLVEEPGETAGRSEDGNFVLSELEVTASAISSGAVSSESAPPQEKRDLLLSAAHADEVRQGFDLWHAIDGLTDTGWAVDAPDLLRLRGRHRAPGTTPATSGRRSKLAAGPLVGHGRPDASTHQLRSLVPDRPLRGTGWGRSIHHRLRAGERGQGEQDLRKRQAEVGTEAAGIRRRQGPPARGRGGRQLPLSHHQSPDPTRDRALFRHERRVEGLAERRAGPGQEREAACCRGGQDHGPLASEWQQPAREGGQLR
jgi:hypothetical protein